MIYHFEHKQYIEVCHVIPNHTDFRVLSPLQAWRYLPLF